MPFSAVEAVGNLQIPDWSRSNLFPLGDWKDTYQKIAVQIDEQMEGRGATALTQRGVADVTEGNITGDFDTWMQDSLWPGVSKAFSTATVDATTESLTSLLHIPSSASDKHPDAIKAQVVEVRALTELEDRPKYHMEIRLPAGASYEVGDYLEVYPHNTKEDMDSLLQVLRIQGHDLPEPLISIMHSRLELHQPASSKVITPAGPSRDLMLLLILVFYSSVILKMLTTRHSKFKH